MRIEVVALTVCLTTFAFAQGYKARNGYVPDSKTAVKIAEAVLIPVYGENQIESERPFEATLKDNIWTVIVRSIARVKGRLAQGVMEGSAKFRFRGTTHASCIFGTASRPLELDGP